LLCQFISVFLRFFMVLLDRIFGKQNEPATVAEFLGDPLDGVVFEVKKGSQSLGKALFVLFDGLVAGVFDAKTTGFGVHPSIQLLETGFHLGITNWGKTNNAFSIANRCSSSQ